MPVHVESHILNGYHQNQTGVIMLPNWQNAAGASLENYLNAKQQHGWELVSACLAEANQRIILIFRS